MTLTAIPFTVQKDSEVLDPEFTAELRAMSLNYEGNQYNVDSDQWSIARIVNDMWPEHKDLKYTVIEDDIQVAKKSVSNKSRILGGMLTGCKYRTQDETLFR